MRENNTAFAVAEMTPYAKSEREVPPLEIRMRLVVAATLLIFTTSALAETLAYGSRVGMEVTVVSKSDIGSAHAAITVKHTKANAVAYCRDYIGKAQVTHFNANFDKSVTQPDPACPTGMERDHCASNHYDQIHDIYQWFVVLFRKGGVVN